LACRYREFKVFDRDGFAETVRSLYVADEDSSKWRYRRRGTILGMMHAHKKELWEQHTTYCPNNGLTAVEMAVRDIEEIVLRDAVAPAPLAAEQFADAMLELGDEYHTVLEEVPF
jgi:hypothetical protein